MHIALGVKGQSRWRVVKEKKRRREGFHGGWMEQTTEGVWERDVSLRSLNAGVIRWLEIWGNMDQLSLPMSSPQPPLDKTLSLANTRNQNKNNI